MSKKYPVEPPVPIRSIYTHTCGHCKGSGQEPGLEDLTCRVCIGRGERRWRIEECKTCNGSGRNRKTLGLTKCKTCKGRGWTPRTAA